MTLARLRDLAPGALGLLEGRDDAHGVRFTLYLREAALPPALAARSAGLAIVAGRLLRTWTLDGTGWGRIDSGLAPDYWTPGAERFRIPSSRRGAPVNGTDADLDLLPVDGPLQAHALSLVRINEVVRAFADGAAPPPFESLPVRAAGDPHYQRDLALFQDSDRETPPCPDATPAA